MTSRFASILGSASLLVLASGGRKGRRYPLHPPSDGPYIGLGVGGAFPP